MQPKCYKFTVSIHLKACQINVRHHLKEDVTVSNKHRNNINKRFLNPCRRLEIATYLDLTRLNQIISKNVPNGGDKTSPLTEL